MTNGHDRSEIEMASRGERIYRSGKRERKNPAAFKTARLNRMYERKLMELAMARFKWEGFPDEIDIRYLERQLLFRALAVFFKDTNGAYMAMQGAPASVLNALDNPTQFLVTGSNYPAKTLWAVEHVVIDPLTQMPVYNDDAITMKMHPAECVPIWANTSRMPDLDIVQIYAERLADLDVTIDINSFNARQTKVIFTSAQAKLSAVNINRQIENGDKVVQISPDARGLLPEALDLGIIPDSHEKLHILRGRLWNECMGLMGINSANQDKKERLVADEVSANDDIVQSMRAVHLSEREAAAKRINNLYGLNVSVSYNTDIDSEASRLNPGDPNAEPDYSDETDREGVDA